MIKSVKLTPQNSNTSNVYILSNIDEVSLLSTYWRVRPNYQHNWAFIIHLDETWLFDANQQSVIYLNVHSPSKATGSDTFDDLIFAFTPNNDEYFSMLISMDDYTYSNKIYPSCNSNSNSNSDGRQFAKGDVASIPDYNRICDIANYSCSNWQYMQPQNIKIPNAFPISFKLENDPSNNQLFVSFASNPYNTYHQKCSFAAFPISNGLKIYIAGNERGQSFLIESFDISLKRYAPTPNPTQAPQSPTFHTLNPTKYPSFAPTLKPTQPPTTPSLAPSLIPTLSSTNAPTIQLLDCDEWHLGYLGVDETVSFRLQFFVDYEDVNINTCTQWTDFDTSLSVYDGRGWKLDFNKDGCNGTSDGSKIILENADAGNYFIKLRASYPKTEGTYNISIQCPNPPSIVSV